MTQRPAPVPDAHARVLQDLLKTMKWAVAHQDDPAEVLEALAGISRVLDRAQRQTVDRMLTQGASWGDIGRRLGVSRQAATQRFGRRS